MKKTKSKKPVKSKIHPRNKHQGRYDLDALAIACPDLKSFIKPNKYGDLSIDFSDANAVKTLNQALLQYYYKLPYWDIPDGYLCPPIPGRADYIHHIVDLLRIYNFGNIPKKITCLDVGTGANCIYPIIGVKEYGWNFIGSDIDPISLKSAQKIIDSDSDLKSSITLKLQPNSKDIFYNVIRRDEQIDLTVCNPPFHASIEDAQKGTKRKLSNLNHKEISKVSLNFGGQSNELWCDGGENKFIKNMIKESKKFSKSCFWFSTLVSKQSNLKGIYEALKSMQAIDVKTIPMGQGNKASRIVAWTFLSSEEQKKWSDDRWK